MLSASSKDYVDFVKEQLAPLPGITSARFFGGVGLSADGLLFAMIMGNSLYFAVDDMTRPGYLAMGSGCFCYNTKKGRVDVSKYFEVPGELLDDRERLQALAIDAIQAARRSRKAGPRSKFPRQVR